MADFLAALFFAILFTIVFGLIGRSKTTTEIVGFFLVTHFLIWGAGLWMNNLGPIPMNPGWLGPASSGLLFLLFVLGMMAYSNNREKRGKPALVEGAEDVTVPAATALGIILIWGALLFAVIAISALF